MPRALPSTEAEAQRFPLREHRQVGLTVTGSLADDEAVTPLLPGVTTLWASIHLAGGFAAGPLRETAQVELTAADRHEFRHLPSCAVAPLERMTRDDAEGAGGRIVNVAARPALEWRTGAGMAPMPRARRRSPR